VIVLAEAVRHLRLQAIATSLDAGADGGLIRIYTGPRPDPVSTLTGQLPLVELRLARPSLLGLADGVMTLVVPPDRLCLRSGRAAWARMLDGSGRTVLDADVGVEGSGAELELDRTDLLAGGAVRITSIEFHEP
jgi:hypothetical protein